MDWTLTLDLQAASPVSDDQAGQLLVALADHGAAAGVLGRRLSLTLTVPDAPTAAAALAAGQASVMVALELVGVVVAGELAAEVLTVGEHDRRLAEPAIPDLVGVSDAAELLGVPRQRVHQLRTAHPHFPAPVAAVRTGPLWTRASVDAFGRSWERRSGRPSRPAARSSGVSG